MLRQELITLKEHTANRHTYAEVAIRNTTSINDQDQISTGTKRQSGGSTTTTENHVEKASV